MNTKLVYISQAKATWPDVENGKWSLSDINITIPPTKCKVTINNDLIINDVYVNINTGGYIFLYNTFSYQKVGYCTDSKENCWVEFFGTGLVLTFKSDNFIIEPI